MPIYNINSTIVEENLRRTGQIIPTLMKTGHLPEGVDCRFYSTWSLNISENETQKISEQSGAILFFDTNTNNLLAILDYDTYFKFIKEKPNNTIRSHEDILKNLYQALTNHLHNQTNIQQMLKTLITVLSNFKSNRQVLDYIDVLVNHDDNNNKILSKLKDFPILDIKFKNLDLFDLKYKNFDTKRSSFTRVETVTAPIMAINTHESSLASLMRILNGETNFAHLPAPDKDNYLASIALLKSMGFTEPAMFYSKLEL